MTTPADDCIAAYNSWWLEQTKRGDPARNPHLVRQAFVAGFKAGGLSGVALVQAEAIRIFAGQPPTQEVKP